MTDKEIFQKTFDKLSASPEILTEVLNMKTERKRKHYINRIAATVAVLVLVIGSGGVVYANDIGGVQRTVQIWIHGDLTDATLRVSDGSYTLKYTDSEGNENYRHGGGVSFDVFGHERPVSDEELMSEINSPEISYEDDGSVIAYYMDQKIDITDKFNDGICYLKIETTDKPIYITIKYQNGCAVSSHRYVPPEEFN